MRSSRPAAQPSGAITTPSASSSSAEAPRRPPSRRAAAAAFPTHFFGDEEPRTAAGTGAATSNDAANGAPGPVASRPSRVSRMKTRADSKVANNKKRKGTANNKDDAPAVASKVARLQTTTAAPPAAAAATAVRRNIPAAGPSMRAGAAKDRSHLARPPQRGGSRRPEPEAEAPAAAGQGSSNHTSAQSRSDPISTGSDEPSWSRRKPTPPQYRAKAATEVELVPALTSATDIDVAPPQEPVQQQQSEPPQQPVQEQQQPEPVTRAAPPPQTTTTATRRVLAPETPADQRRGIEQQQQQRQQRYVPGQETPTRPRAESDDRLATSTRRNTTATSRRLGIGFGQPMNTMKSFAQVGVPNRRLAALGARPVVSQSVDAASSQEAGATTMLEVDETRDAHSEADEAAGAGDDVFQVSASLPPPRPPPLPLATDDPAPLPDKEASDQMERTGATPLIAAEASVAQSSSAAAAAAAPSSSSSSSEALEGRYIVKVERWVMASDEENQEAPRRDATSSSSPASNEDAAAAAAQIDRILSAADDEYRRQLSPDAEDSRRANEVSTTGVAAQGRSAIEQGKLVPVQAKIWRRGGGSRGKHASAAADAANTYRLKGAGPPKRSAVVRWAKRWGIGEDDG